MKTRTAAPPGGSPADRTQYATARLYLMLEALCSEGAAPGRYELDWADDLVEEIGVPEIVMDEARADHATMMRGRHSIE